MLRDLLAVEVVATVNVALCEYHQKHCPATEQMTAECTKVGQTLQDLQPMTALRLCHACTTT